METTTNPAGPIHFLNIEYFFRIIYDVLHGNFGGNPNPTPGTGSAFDFSAFLSLLTHIWFALCVLAFILCALATWLILYTAIRIKQVRDMELTKYGTLAAPDAEALVEHSRWKYISELIESGAESDWRNAIIEADIMLDDMLTRIGLVGQTVADKLKAANPAHFHTLQDAWEAHKVRNDIAHHGSQFQLTNHMAYQTIQRFRNVFEEFHEI